MTIASQYKAHDALLDRAMSDPKLSAACWRVLWFLRQRHNYKRNTSPRHKLATIARAIGADRKTVKRAMSTLVERGYVERIETGKHHNPYSYKLHSKGDSFGGSELPPLRGTELSGKGDRIAPLLPYNNKDKDTGSILRASARVDPQVLEDWEELKTTFRDFASNQNFEQYFGTGSGLRALEVTPERVRLLQPDLFLCEYTKDTYKAKMERAIGRVVEIVSVC